MGNIILRSIISKGGDDRGMALVIALLMLLVLTLIGINAITTTTYETSISGNERVATDAFYAAEAGIQVALNQLPDTESDNAPKDVGENSRYRKRINYLGEYAMSGFEASWFFKRYQANATGESFGAMKEIEVQVTYGPVPAGTGY